MPIPLGILAVAGAGAAGAASSFDLLETVTPTATGTVTFTGLGSYTEYKHLQIRIVARSNNAQGGIGSIFLRFNSSSTGYARHSLLGNGSAVSSTANTSEAEITLQAAMNDGAESNVFASAVIDILDFSNSSKNTTIRALIGGHTSGTTQIRLLSGLWNNTAAVTSFTLVAGSSANYLTGTRMSLYGIK